MVASYPILACAAHSIGGLELVVGLQRSLAGDPTRLFFGDRYQPLGRYLRPETTGGDLNIHQPIEFHPSRKFLRLREGPGRAKGSRERQSPVKPPCPSSAFLEAPAAISSMLIADHDFSSRKRSCRM